MEFIWECREFGERFRDYPETTTVCIVLGDTVNGYVKDVTCGGILGSGDRWWLVHHGKEIDIWDWSDGKMPEERIERFVRRNPETENIQRVIVQVKGR